MATAQFEDSIRLLVEEHARQVKSEVEECLRNCSPQFVANYSRLGDFYEAYNCERISKELGKALIQKGIRCLRNRGHVDHDGQALFRQGEFHDWLVIPNYYQILDITIGYWIHVRQGLDSRPAQDAFVPVLSNEGNPPGLAYHVYWEVRWDHNSGAWGDQEDVDSS